MTLNLSDLEASARQHGWSTAIASVGEIRIAARYLGWKEVPTREGEPTVADLRPTNQQDALPHSLSATYGTGAQPLHTDGAHLADPPDLVIVCADEPNNTPTLIWTVLSDAGHPPGLWTNAADGVFLVNNGPNSFFTTVRWASGIRYDPGCMEACDQRARHVAQFFEEAAADTHRYDWGAANQVLVIDNRKTLHARAAVPDHDMSRLLHRIAFSTKKPQ